MTDHHGYVPNVVFKSGPFLIPGISPTVTHQ